MLFRQAKTQTLLLSGDCLRDSRNLKKKKKKEMQVRAQKENSEEVKLLVGFCHTGNKALISTLQNTILGHVYPYFMSKDIQLHN